MGRTSSGHVLNAESLCATIVVFRFATIVGLRIGECPEAICRRMWRLDVWDSNVETAEVHKMLRRDTLEFQSEERRES